MLNFNWLVIVLEISVIVMIVNISWNVINMVVGRVFVSGIFIVVVCVFGLVVIVLMLMRFLRF